MVSEGRGILKTKDFLGEGGTAKAPSDTKPCWPLMCYWTQIFARLMLGSYANYKSVIAFGAAVVVSQISITTTIN